MNKITLTDDQNKALKAFSKFLVTPKEKYLIIQGSAGTGKSTLIRYLIKSLDAQMQIYAVLLQTNKTKSDFEAVLTATTNKAVDVLSELTEMPAKTIHSLLGLTVKSNVSTGTVKLTKKADYQLLYNKLIIIDEASMINDELFRLIDETTVDCKIVLIGDKYQLAPVRQMIPIMDSVGCPVATLDKVMRHSGPILQTSVKFRQTVETDEWSDVPDLPELQQVDGPTFQKLMDAAFTDPGYTINGTKVLAWTNRRVREYNRHIRQVKGYPEILQVGEIMYTNKPIMTTRHHWPTDSKIAITKVGPITHSHNIEGRMVELNGILSLFLPESQDTAKVLFNKLAKEKKWGIFFELKEGWLDLRPAYASTVHKAQGATYDTVFIDLGDIGRCNIASDVARMLYVSISRAAKQIYFYGKLPLKYQPA